MLGLVPGTERADHVVDLPVGATVLLYTDGLIERRGEDLDEGIARLCAVLGEVGRLPLENVCDEVLQRMLPAGGADDDVALLALRTFSEDAPRPAEAGPKRTPDASVAGTQTREDTSPGLTELPPDAL
jgi:hypothetical protein